MHLLNPYLNAKPDFVQLARLHPSFGEFVTISPESGYGSIDFQDAAALRELTRVLLKEDWALTVELREDRLCPTIANRLDYLYHILDIEPFLPPKSEEPLRVLDVGTGAIAIYPILLHRLRPTANIIATESDPTSLAHAHQTLKSNTILEDRIKLLQYHESSPIIFPLLELDTYARIDFIICNPPFFSSEQEMQEGQEIKKTSAHAAATASGNELITPGGEVEFVSKMIEESQAIRERCSWYTSLIGKYSSLPFLVDRLRSAKIDNYFVLSIRQARTTRWILGWSYLSIRLPDSITRPEPIYPNTSFTRLLPAPNTLRLVPKPPKTVAELMAAISPVLSSIHLIAADQPLGSSPQNPEDESVPGPQEMEMEMEMELVAMSNTWSRAARRQAMRGESQASATVAIEADAFHTEQKPLIRATIRFVPSPATSTSTSTGTSDGEGYGAGVELIWRYGRDREVFDSLWKFILSKSGLLTSGSAHGELHDPRGSPQSRIPNTRGRGQGRGGGRGRGRGRGRIAL